jgi:demethylmenaquinone methyltransferase/2-methoxy-6-polyprenyl-1,4-benzoquinol methylase
VPVTTARQLFEPLGPTYDRYSALLSFGQDPRWRRFLVSRLEVRADETALDVATGTGLVARELVRRFGCSVVGIDQSPEMLAVARERTRGLPVEVVEGRAEELPFADGEFASLTFTYLLRYVDDPATTMRELARVVRPGGTVAMLEFAVPRGVWRPPWELWVRVGLPGLGRLISPGWNEVGRFLGPSIRGFWSRYDPVALFRAAGLEDVQFRRLSLGGGIVVWGRRGGVGSTEPHESGGAGFAGAGAGK